MRKENGLFRDQAQSRTKCHPGLKRLPVFKPSCISVLIRQCGPSCYGLCINNRRIAWRISIPAEPSVDQRLPSAVNLELQHPVDLFKNEFSILGIRVEDRSSTPRISVPANKGGRRRFAEVIAICCKCLAIVSPARLISLRGLHDQGENCLAGKEVDLRRATFLSSEYAFKKTIARLRGLDCSKQLVRLMCILFP